MELFKAIVVSLICGVTFLSFAEDNTSNDLSKASQAACAREFATSKLDPLRSKLPVGWRANVTDEMRGNEAKPSASERSAIKSYMDADMACDRYLAIEFFPSDQDARKEWIDKSKKNLVDRFDMLRTGKITYAEYFRQQDKRNAEALEKLNSWRSEHQFEMRTYDWLSTFKAKWPEKSPWWNFYNFAVTTAKDVDNGKITEDVGLKMIEERRLKTNEQVAAAEAPKPVTLNCALRNENGKPLENAVQIDYGRKLVNGNVAEFYENEIRWRFVSGNTEFNFRLNRLSGFMTSGTTEFPALFSGHCTQAIKQF